jgi:hypothetical protein
MLALLVGGLFDSPANEVSRFLAVWLFLNFTTENLL